MTDETVDPLDLDAIREREAAIGVAMHADSADTNYVIRTIPAPVDDAIQASLDDVPALIAEVERLRLALEEARADRDTSVSASEEEVAEALDPAAWGCHGGCTICQVARESSVRKASALLARFNITPKAADR